jgi:hypothetical protein
MASYPAALWAPDHIVDGTVLEASLFTDTDGEIDAVEAELGTNIQGTAGSLAERMDMFMDDDGGVSNVKLVDADDGERRRMRAGVTVVNADDMDHRTYSSRITITFSPPLQALRNVCRTILQIQSLDVDALGSSDIPCLVSTVSFSTTGFTIDVSTGGANPLVSGQSFILHWLVFENNFSSTVELP